MGVGNPPSVSVDGDEQHTQAKIVKLPGRGELHLACNWDVGIGGGLWDTGLLLTEHLCSKAFLYDRFFKGKRILELGSGTGLVGLAAARFGPPREVVITDLDSHLNICIRNVAWNSSPSSVSSETKVRVEQYDWKQEPPPKIGKMPFDVILGTDVAYYEHLYTPLIKALSHASGRDTLILLGVTRSDTGPAFFDALDQVGTSDIDDVSARTRKTFLVAAVPIGVSSLP